MPNYLTIKQAARRLGCSPGRVLKLIKRGSLAAHQETDLKAGRYSGNLRYMICEKSVQVREAAEPAKEIP